MSQDINNNIIPLYLLYVVGTSESMAEHTQYRTREGKSPTKIEEVRDGFKRVIDSAVALEKSNPFYNVYIEILSFDSSYQRIFNGFKRVSSDMHIDFTLHAHQDVQVAFDSIDEVLNDELILSDRVKNISVILISDSDPVADSGSVIPQDNINSKIDSLKNSLNLRGLENHIDYYTISLATGPSGENALRYMADNGFDAGEDSHYYGLGRRDSITQVMEMLTSSAIAEHMVRSDKVDASLIKDSENATSIIADTILEGNDEEVVDGLIDDSIDEELCASDTLSLGDIEILPDDKPAEKVARIELDILTKQEKKSLEDSDIGIDCAGNNIEVDFDDTNLDIE